MENINEYGIAYAEILEILKYIPKPDYDKIPKEKINLFNRKKDEKYEFKYNPNKSLDENKVSKRAKAIIIILFRDYWSKNNQREKILAKQNNDRRMIENEKVEKYNYEDVFKKSNNNKIETIEEQINSSDTKMIVYKENFITKIINKIKNFFNIK